MGNFNFTNKAAMSLAIAPFLALDTYQYDPDPRAISATTLIKPIRMLVLTKRNQELQKEVDLIDMAASSMGSAFHARLEQAWKTPELLRAVFRSFGYGDHELARVVVNPEDDANMAPDIIPVYTEKRFYKEINGWKLSGQADLILNSALHDFKSGSVWGYIYDSNAEDYIAQGSIYRWLSDGKIKGGLLHIEYMFTDWSQAEARRKKDYPQLRIVQKKYQLWSLEKTEKYVIDKLNRLDDLYDMDQSLLPQCTKEELWQSETVYKYFKNPSAKRATKNFDNHHDAQAARDYYDCGIIKTIPGQVKRCTYCNVVDICHQAKQLHKQGLLVK